MQPPARRWAAAAPSPGKLTELEALRGLAAFAVFAGHFFEGLVPVLSLTHPGTTLIGFFDGPPVILFFVLSGFVLTLRPLSDRRLSALPGLALRRWPRLAGTVTFASLFYIAAAWLGCFPPIGTPTTLDGPYPPYLFWGADMHNRDIGAVLWEAAAGTFLHGTSKHNGVLWTMHWEWLGSLLAYVLAGILMLRGPRFLRAAAFLSVSLAGVWYHPWFEVFPLGVAGAWLHLRFHQRMRIPLAVAIPLFFAAIFLWSWDVKFGTGVWVWSARLDITTRIRLWIFVETLAGAALMAIALYTPHVTRALRTSAGYLAGQFSFPLYLMHLLVMLSLGAWIRVISGNAPMTPLRAAALFAAILAVTLTLCLPIRAFDHWWTRRLAGAGRK